MSLGVKGKPIRQFSVSSPVLTVRRFAKTDTPEEMQCDVVRFGVMHAGPFQSLQHNQSQSISPPPCRLAHHCSLVTQTLRDRPAKQFGNSPARILRSPWSPPLSRMRIQTLPWPSHAEVSMHAKMRFAAVTHHSVQKSYESLDTPSKEPGFVLPDPTQARFPEPARRKGWQPKARLPQRKPLQRPREDPGKAGQRIHAWLCKHHNQTVISAALLTPDAAGQNFVLRHYFLHFLQREVFCH